MFLFRDALSPRKRYWLGFLVCPVLTWFSLGGQILLFSVVSEWWPRLLNSKSALLFLSLFLSECAFWVSVPLLSGVSAAFFWSDWNNDANHNEQAVVFWSVALAWLPSIVLSCAIIFTLPVFLIFLALYHQGLWRGHVFWNSSRPRQWLGDFSDFDSP